MKNSALIFLISVFSAASFAVTPKIDSLKKACQDAGLSDFDKTIEICDLGIRASEASRDSVSLAWFNRNIGVAYYFKGEYEAASKFYFKSITILEKANQPSELAAAYNDLAKLYRKTRKLKQAEENYDKAMSIYVVLKDSNNIAAIYNESGVVFEYAGDYEKALERYRLSLGMSEKLGSKVGVAYALNNIAGALSLQQKFNEAEVYLKKALEIRKGMRDTFALAINYSDLGVNYYSAKLPKQAIAYLDSSNQIAYDLKYAELLSNNFLFISKAYEELGEHEKSLLFFKRHVNLKDSVFTLESEKQLNELTTKYQTEKKDLELVKNKAEIESQRYSNFIKNIVILSILIFVLLLAFISYQFYKKKQIEQKAKADAELAKEKEIRTKAIVEAEEKERRRIAQDLHDGVGQILSAAKLNLSSLQSKIQLNTPEEKEAMANALSLVDDSVKEVRTVSHSMMPNTLLKLGLASAVKEFVTKMGNLPNLKVDLEIVGMEKRLDDQTETVLYRVIQEVVNNIIKHAKANTINLQLIRHEDELTVMIEDNGVGFDTGKINEFGGIGLKNIISRIEFLSGTVHFDSTPGKGTNVIIEVPISK